MINITFLSSQRAKDSVILYGISFAIGGLLGDVFFHTLPHMYADCTEESAHQQQEINFIIVIGIISFFLVEKMTHHFLSDGNGHGSHHGHHHHHGSEKSGDKQKSEAEESKNRGKVVPKNTK